MGCVARNEEEMVNKVFCAVVCFPEQLLGHRVYCQAWLGQPQWAPAGPNELNAQLASDYFKKELAEAQNITESIESGTVGNSGDSAKFAKTAKYMVKKYPDIYSLQLIHCYQSIDVYHKKATRVGKSSLLGEARVKKAFEYCRKERINGIVGPLCRENDREGNDGGLPPGYGQGRTGTTGL